MSHSIDWPTSERRSISIVLLGDFNPKIFQPAWFAAEGLIPKKEAEEAELEIIHPEVVVFNLAWLRLEVTRDRFSALTLQEPFEILRDLGLGTFHLLRHTPLRQMGINAELHVRMKSEGEWHHLGNRLAPEEIWKDLLEKPGMRTLTMEGMRPDGLKGYVRVRVDPSQAVHPGVFIQVNDHYEVRDPSKVIGATEMVSILEQHWVESLQRSARIVNTLIERI
jgi:hypothetical protein